MPETAPSRVLREFLHSESAPGIALVAATVAALVWANVAPATYHHVWAHTVSLPGPRHALSIEQWINEGLMTIFFFVVGLEIKREVLEGDLRDRRTAIVPVVAAVGGMVLPAILYASVTAGTSVGHGWGIPMATDIAFAVGVLRLAGPRVPGGLGLTLLTLAIVDDLGAILVIAVFYSQGISLPWLLAAAGLMVAIRLLARVVDHPVVYVVPALLLWVAALRSGIHPTIAGVALAFLTPMHDRHGRPVLERLEEALGGWSSFVVLPVFALANAGIVVTRDSLDHALASPATLGILLGLVVGKTLGIGGGVALAVRFGGQLPEGVGRREGFALGLLGGIGLTVSLFVAGLAFTGLDLDAAKLAVLAASTASAVLALVVLRTIRPIRPDPDART